MAQADTIPSHADPDPLETAEWLESLRSVLENQGPERVSFLLTELSEAAHREGVELPFTANTPYINTIPADKQPPYPGQPRDRAAHQEHHPLERDGDGRRGPTRPRRHRRPHLDLRLGRHAVRSRPSTTSSAARATTTRATRSISRATPRPACTPGPFSKAGSTEAAPGQLPPRAGRRRRAVVAIRIPG